MLQRGFGSLQSRKLTRHSKEMIIYEESKTIPNNMINFSRPMTTQSNSVESETAFFGFGCFVTKLRNRCNIKCFNVFTDLF